MNIIFQLCFPNSVPEFTYFILILLRFRVISDKILGTMTYQVPDEFFKVI